MNITDEDSFWEAVDAVNELPYGRTRSAATEELVAAAERFGGGEKLAWALLRQINAYNYAGESGKSPVPVFRLLKLWDTQPEAFEERLTHNLFWDLKWVTSSLLGNPDVPLESIRGFQTEFERRYSMSGNSLRPVFQSRFYLEKHIGAEAAAQDAFGQWLAADRDDLADCHACERREQGRWLIRNGDHTGGLELFAPTLAGELTCAEEPAVTLGASLKSLVLTGDCAAARSNHLRGYRLTRGKVQSYPLIGTHLEFCALTGNEGRGLEILAEHRDWLLDPVPDLDDQQGLYEGVVVLLRRLVTLGKGDLEVVDGTVSSVLAEVERRLWDICARFDARNSSTVVSDQARERVGQEPWVTALPLGVRSTVVATTAPVAVSASVAGVSRDEALAAEETGRPDALALWERYAAATPELTPLDEAILTDLRARDVINSDAAKSAVLLEQAAAQYDAAGEPGRAICARAWSVAAASDTDDWDTGLARLDALNDEVSVLDSARPLEVLQVRQARVNLYLNRHQREDDPAPELLTTTVDLLDSMIEESVRLDLPVRHGRTLGIRGTVRLWQDRVPEAEADLRAAIDVLRTSDRPWYLDQPLRMLGQVLLHGDEPASAAPLFRECLELQRAWPDREDSPSYVLLFLSQSLTAAGNYDEALGVTFEAVRAFELDGDAFMTASAQFTAAQILSRLERPADAAALLEDCLPFMDAEFEPDAAVQARWILGGHLSTLGENRRAAEELAKAAEVASGLENRTLYVTIAEEAAHALNAAGLHAEAEQAFTTVVEARLAGDQPQCAVFPLRAAAWNLMEQHGPEAADRATALFGQALRALEDVSVPDPEEQEHWEVQRGETHRQLAHLLLGADRTTPALVQADKAAELLGALLPGTASGYADAQVLAARIEAWQLKQAGPVEPVKPKFWSLGKKQAAVVPRLESAAALLREHGEAETADELLELQTQLA